MKIDEENELRWGAALLSIAQKHGRIPQRIGQRVVFC